MLLLNASQMLKICTDYKTYNFNFYNSVIQILCAISIIVPEMRKIHKQQNPYPSPLFNIDFPFL